MNTLSIQRAEHFCQAAGIRLTQDSLKALRWAYEEGWGDGWFDSRESIPAERSKSPYQPMRITP